MVKWMFFFVWYLGGSGGGELEGGNGRVKDIARIIAGYSS